MKKFISERGQSLVELGVSLLILLYLLSGAAEFGVLFFQFVQLRDAAQEGALYGSMNPYIDSNSDGTFDVGEPVNQAGIELRVRAASSSPINFSRSDSASFRSVISRAKATTWSPSAYCSNRALTSTGKIMPALWR